MPTNNRLKTKARIRQLLSPTNKGSKVFFLLKNETESLVANRVWKNVRIFAKKYR